jgi:tetratricopeptide (TPR) repeat protein
MPPNPHAFKILEDSFLLGNVVLFLLLGIGFVRLGNIRLTETALLLFLIVGFNLLENGKNNFHRFNFSAPDYGKNILRSCPPDTLLVQKKDIQLFSIWWLQSVQRNRPDIVSVAEGLSGSPWYWKMLARRYPGLRLFRLSSPGGLENFIRQNPGQRVALSVDSEIPPPEKLSITERGLVRSVGQENYFPFEEFYIWRQRPRDFFSQNLFTDYGRAYQNRGSRRLSQKKYSLARDDFIAAYAFDDDLAIALSWRAYAYLAENNFAAAWRNYQFCAKNYQRIIKLAYTYKAFPDVIDSFENELLGVYINLGVVAERLGRLEEARWAYQAGLAIRPSAQLYFNQAVLYWKENNFPLVEENLRRALELDPNYPQARFYYQLVRQKLQPVR